jgi:protein gp37
MSGLSKIEWTDATWNPLRGCTKISPGCKFCYAEAFAERFRGVPGHPYEKGFDFRLVPEKLNEPLRWKKPRMIFVNSMSDLFQDKVPLDYIKKTFDVMAEANWHVFQILTKRSERLLELSSELNWPPNVWMGVSIEAKRYTYRSRDLSKVPAAVRFISAEPLLEMIPYLPLKKIDWVIVGGESGRKARQMELEWARSIRNQCENTGVSFFLKQLGGKFDKRGGQKALLDGRTWREFPRSRDESQKSVIGI